MARFTIPWEAIFANLWTPMLANLWTVSKYINLNVCKSMNSNNYKSINVNVCKSMRSNVCKSTKCNVFAKYWELVILTRLLQNDVTDVVLVHMFKYLASDKLIPFNIFWNSKYRNPQTWYDHIFDFTPFQYSINLMMQLKNPSAWMHILFTKFSQNLRLKIESFCYLPHIY